MNSTSQEWNDPASWDNGVPGCFDSIIIPTGVLIEITSTVDLTPCPSTVIVVEGELFFQTGKKLIMTEGSQILIPNGGSIQGGNGGGNSSYIEIGADIVWAATDGNLSGPEYLCPACPLSIELTYFRASCDDNLNVQIEWRTDSQKDNAYFTVKRSFNGNIWEDIATEEGAGTTNEVLDYSIVDVPNYTGTIYYQLKQTDINGQQESFNVEAVYLTLNENMSIYPNPSSGEITIECKTDIIDPPKFYNVIGEDISNHVSMTEDNLISRSYDLSKIPAGVYLIILGAESRRLIKK